MVFGDWRMGATKVMTLLTLKTECWKQLPWLLIGLAATNEEDARKVANAILDKWAVDPRREVHHRITWQLLQPGSQFVNQLQDFADGRPRDQLSRRFLTEVAKYRFIPIVETTIEEKHARVSQGWRQHYISPVRVSLCNRMPMLERLILKEQIQVPELLEAFTSVRQLRLVPGLLNVETHHLLLDRSNLSSQYLRNIIMSIVYQTNLESMFHSTATAKRHHKRRKDQLDRAAAKLVGAPKLPVFDKMMRDLMQGHLMKTSKPGLTYSAPRSILDHVALCPTLGQPRTAPAAEALAENPGIDIDEDVHAIGFFQIVLANPSAKKTVPIAIGSGGKIPARSLAVTFHTVVGSAGDSPVVMSRPLSRGDYPDANFLLLGFKDSQMMMR